MFNQNSKYFKRSTMYGISASRTSYPELDEDVILHLWIQGQTDFYRSKFKWNFAAKVWENDTGLSLFSDLPKLSDLSNKQILSNSKKKDIAESVRDGLEITNYPLDDVYINSIFSTTISSIDPVNGFTVNVKNHNHPPKLFPPFDHLTILARSGKFHIRFH